MSKRIIYAMLTPLALAILSSFALAQQQGQNNGPQPPRLNGIVFDIKDRSFSIIDKQGKVTPITCNDSTQFLSRKNPAPFADVVKYGMNVRIDLAPDGSPSQITATGLTSSVNVNQLQIFLHAKDDEWAVIKPKIDRVHELRRVLDGNPPTNANGQPDASIPNIDAMEKSLQADYFDASAPDADLATHLNSLREAKAQLQIQLQSAKHDLTQLLTPRQEALLVIVGILD